jgi:hypothetical protein
MEEAMKWDLKKPCKNCPFVNTKDGIKFADRSRAEEIEEQAYRHGFPCHLSAVHVEETDRCEGGFVFGPNTQHCAGATLVHLKDMDGSVPFQNLPEKQQDKIRDRLDWNAPVYESVEEFLAASTKKEVRREVKKTVAHGRKGARVEGNPRRNAQPTANSRGSQRSRPARR